jgi:hypothetical protein
MAEMAESPTDELRMLRLRAYGPDADIHDDPAALARLHDLEERALASRPAAPRAAAEPPTSLAPPASDEPPVEREPAREPAAQTRAPASTEQLREPAETPDTDEPAVAGGRDGSTGEKARWKLPRGRTLWLWAGSVVVAFVVGAWVALGMSAVGFGRVAVLAETPADNWPTEFFGDPAEGAMVFEAYLGLTAMVIPNAMGNGGPGETTCLAVFDGLSDDGTLDPTAAGVVTNGCGAGRFEPQATVTVSSTMSDELRAEHPDGTALQFVLRGSEVFVFADDSAATPSPAP